MTVEFEGDNEGRGTILYSRFQKSAQVPTMVHWLMKMGIKSEHVANIVLLIIVIGVIAGSVVIYNFSKNPDTSIKHNVYHKKTITK